VAQPSAVKADVPTNKLDTACPLGVPFADRAVAAPLARAGARFCSGPSKSKSPARGCRSIARRACHGLLPYAAQAEGPPWRALLPVRLRTFYPCLSALSSNPAAALAPGRISSRGVKNPSQIGPSLLNFLRTPQRKSAKAHRQECLCYSCALDHGQSSAVATNPAFTGFCSIYPRILSNCAPFRTQ